MATGRRWCNGQEKGDRVVEKGNRGLDERSRRWSPKDSIWLPLREGGVRGASLGGKWGLHVDWEPWGVAD